MLRGGRGGDAAGAPQAGEAPRGLAHSAEQLALTTSLLLRLGVVVRVKVRLRVGIRLRLRIRVRVRVRVGLGLGSDSWWPGLD